jgi:hypothetical protein
MGGCTSRLKDDEVKDHENIQNTRNDHAFIIHHELDYLNTVESHMNASTQEERVTLERI